ncbi:PEP-CTERM sorting domain-containing protein [Pseudodesulfovibrio karagichevae]|uniref:PEP-CTERM sorting domain-containing protein n=1 Tax=Pseudodesulfovibrio karagichevae TaxID=3239305 RepID=A0ABV4K2V5_9BACT
MSVSQRDVTIVTALVLAVGLMVSSPARASFIVDTGHSSSTSVSGLVLEAYRVYGFEPNLTITPSNSWVAAEFTLDAQYVITDVLGWMGRDRRPEYNLFSLKIYGDGGDVPNATEYLSGDFTVGYQELAWNGLTGLDLTLDAGTYWVAFEVPGQILIDNVLTANLSRAVMPTRAPDPLGNDAWLYKGEWLPDSGDNLDFGVRILGDTPSIAPVPEPGTMMLLGMGFMGLVGFTRRKR